MHQYLLIIGKRGFLGKNLHKFFNKKFKSKIIHFKDIYKFKKEINGFDYVINTSINKNYINKRYLKKYDNDLKISKLINSRETTYIFLSSRKVYKEKANIKEESKLLPKSHYSKNKLITEQNLKKEFGKNLLILRISNIIGYKENLKNHLHETFIDYFYKHAKRGIIFDNLKKFIEPNESVYIPLGVKHRLSNPTKFPLILIEVQSGNYLGEDDIKRFEDILEDYLI